MRKFDLQIQDSRNIQQGLIINAGGYTHSSVAIHDALKILTIPIIELHISNIYNREEDVGYIRLNIISVGSEQFIRVKSCVKLPCSDKSNHIEELIVSDMSSK